MFKRVNLLKISWRQANFKLNVKDLNKKAFLGLENVSSPFCRDFCKGMFYYHLLQNFDTLKCVKIACQNKLAKLVNCSRNFGTVKVEIYVDHNLQLFAPKVSIEVKNGIFHYSAGIKIQCN